MVICGGSIAPRGLGAGAVEMVVTLLEGAGARNLVVATGASAERLGHTIVCGIEAGTFLPALPLPLSLHQRRTTRNASPSLPSLFFI